jgi:DNA-directed RNA polymerase alpha subunit
MNLDDLEISVRAYCCLKSAGINTVEDLCNQTENDIM